MEVQEPIEKCVALFCGVWSGVDLKKNGWGVKWSLQMDMEFGLMAEKWSGLKPIFSGGSS